MATCWRCLLQRHSQLRPSRLPIKSTLYPGPILATCQTTSFSTSAPLLKKSRKKAQSRVKSYKVPAPGERKALRKRIVLSNSNALEIPDLQDLQTEHTTKAGIEELQGQILGFSNDSVDQLRAAEGFRHTQNWGFFRRPASLIRKETVELAELLDGVEKGESGAKETVARILSGEKWSGKSVLMLQAQAMAFLKGWIVITIPEANDLTNATTAYAPIPDSNSSSTPTRYYQKNYTAALLARIAKSNNQVLSTIPLQNSYPDLGNTSSSSSSNSSSKKPSSSSGTTTKNPTQTSHPPLEATTSTLLDLALAGSSDPEIAHEAFCAFWDELTSSSTMTTKTNPRPPLLITIHNIASLAGPSRYLTPSMTYIPSRSLHLPDLLLSYLARERTLPSGGLILAEHTTGGQDPPQLRNKTAGMRAVDAALRADRGTSETESALLDPSAPFTPFAPLGPSARADLALRVAAVPKPHARALLEYFARSGLLRAKVTEKLVAERWALAGSGNMGELEGGVVRWAGGWLGGV